MPAAVSQLCEAMRRGDLVAARTLDAALAPVTDACFVESNPIPAKAMLAMMGKMQDRLRLPLVPLAEPHRVSVRATLSAAGIPVS